MKAKFELNVNLNYIKSLLQERESQSYIAHGPLSNHTVFTPNFPQNLQANLSFFLSRKSL